MRILLTRPREDSEKLARTLNRLGYDTTLEPLISIRHCGQKELNLSLYEAALLTSANGARALAQATPKRDIPLYAVGDATARAALAAGFEEVHTAGGNVDKLTELVSHSLDPNTGPLLHIAGKVIAGDLQGHLKEFGFQVDRIVLYAAEAATALTPATCTALEEGRFDYIVFYSPRTAHIFAKLVGQHHLQDRLSSVSALCLSPAVADALEPLGFKDCIIAAEPTTASLFAPLGINILEDGAL